MFKGSQDEENFGIEFVHKHLNMEESNKDAQLAPVAKESSINPSVLTKVVDLVAGKNADLAKKEWVETNIRSIKEAVKGGKHGTLYYPASGRDIIRPLFAYDVDHLIVIDNAEGLAGEAERQLNELGIEYMVKVSPDGKRRDIVFEFDGRQRRITESSENADLVSPKDFGLDKVDILHIYLPTGSNINRKFTLEHYATVSEGGFLVFEEGKLVDGGYVDESLLKIIGLEEKNIVGRHPHTVKTFAHGPIDPKDRNGIVYQKTKDVGKDVIRIFNDVVKQWLNVDLEFSNFRMGIFDAFGIDLGKIDVKGAIGITYSRLIEETKTLAQRFIDAGIDPKLTSGYQERILKKFKSRIIELQKEFANLMPIYKEISAEVDSGSKTWGKAYKERFVKRDTNGFAVDSAPYNFFGPLMDGMYTREQVDEVVKQFLEAKFDF